MIEKPTLYLLFNHQLTAEQKKDVYETLNIEKIVSFPNDLLDLWRNIPSEFETLKGYLQPIKNYMDNNLKKGDFLLVQGDFGATYMIVCSAKQIGVIPLYATTKRVSTEKIVDGEFVKTSVFCHVRFRKYEA